MGRVRDLAGQRFGRVVVLGRAPSRREACGNVRASWRWRCDCGTERVSTGQVVQGLESCGCTRNPDLTGRTVGAWRILARGGRRWNAQTWIAQCPCGVRVRIRTADLRRQRSCGCARRAERDVWVPGGSPALRAHWERVLEQEGKPAEIRTGRSLVLMDPAVIDDPWNAWDLGLERAVRFRAPTVRF